jgi:hypothetical protein
MSLVILIRQGLIFCFCLHSKIYIVLNNTIVLGDCCLCYNFHVQFVKGDSMFLMSKHHTSGTIGGQSKHLIVRCGIVSGVASDMFHGVPIGNGVHKVEMQGVVLPKTFLMFSNSKDDLPQLLLKDVKGQFTLWEGASM